MNTTRRCVALGLALGLCGSLAPAQIFIGPQVRVDLGNTGSGVEPTVAFVRDVSTMEAVAASIDWREGVPRVGFGITFDGGVTWQEGMLRPVADPWDPDYAVDPYAWADANTGEIWLLATGGQSGSSFNRLLAAVRGQGVGAASMPAAALLTDGDATEHRPIMAAGPCQQFRASRTCTSYGVACRTPLR